MTRKFLFQHLGLAPVPGLCDVQQGQGQSAASHPVTEDEALLIGIDAVNRALARMQPLTRKQAPIVGAEPHQKGT